MADDEFVPFSKRPEWDDVTPVNQDDGPAPLCAIAYTPQFSSTMNYFRAIIQSNEKSERVLALTWEVIGVNPANYTVWHYRRLVIDALKADPKQELERTAAIVKSNPKNYQVWYHRQAMMERLNDPSGELEFIENMLVDDNKNYHAWQHRQYVLTTYKLWDGELAFVDRMLKDDVRNNSAWNQRYFVVTSTEGPNDQWSPEIRQREIDFAWKHVRRAPNNPSPWSYLKGVMAPESALEVRKTCLAAAKDFPSCAHTFALLVDIAEKSGDKEMLKEGVEYCEKLAKVFDEIRTKYWRFRGAQLTKQLETLA